MLILELLYRSQSVTEAVILSHLILLLKQLKRCLPRLEDATLNLYDRVDQPTLIFNYLGRDRSIFVLLRHLLTGSSKNLKK